MKRNCDHCGKPYKADTRNLKRGWGLCCSKSCAAKKREKNSIKNYKVSPYDDVHPMSDDAF